MYAKISVTSIFYASISLGNGINIIGKLCFRNPEVCLLSKIFERIKIYKIFPRTIIFIFIKNSNTYSNRRFYDLRKKGGSGFCEDERFLGINRE
jgi:hypothetical protein